MSRTFRPGSASVTVGSVLSTWRSAIDAVGAVRSTTTLCTETVTCAKLSVAWTRIARGPSAGSDHATSYGAVVSSEIDCQTPVEQSRLVSEHSAKLTSATPVAGSLAPA